jgi:hypothetical protein
MIDVPRYLQTVFRAGPDGISTETVAAVVDAELWDAQAVLMSLFRARKLARLPNPKGRGLVWRIPLRGDAEAGLMWDLSGDPKIVRERPALKPRPQKLRRKIQPAQLDLF